jgi:hypothetical protein
MREENKLEDAGWQFGFKLKNEHIWDAFIVLAVGIITWLGTSYNNAKPV